MALYENNSNYYVHQGCPAIFNVIILYILYNYGSLPNHYLTDNLSIDQNFTYYHFNELMKTINEFRVRLTMVYAHGINAILSNLRRNLPCILTINVYMLNSKIIDYSSYIRSLKIYTFWNNKKIHEILIEKYISEIRLKIIFFYKTHYE